MVNSFITTNRFFDKKNYPRGFSRHGDFTIREAQILERYGYAFNELSLERRQPVTDEERSFLEVCRGLRSAKTEEERVWLKYISLIKNPKRFHTLSGGKPQMDSVEDLIDIYD